MNKKPLTLSIIIPVYNEQSHLKRCLDSIAAQTIKPDEVIIVDNNCSDDSIKIAQRYSFVTVARERQQGIVYARNRGFNLAKSQLIGRIDADSIVPINWVEHIKTTSQQREGDYAATGPCSFRIGVLSRIFMFIHYMIYFVSSRLLLGHNPLFGSNMYLTRSSWQTVKDEVCIRRDIHEDMDLAIHLRQHQVPVFFDKDLQADLSMRRWHHGLHYPKMWIKTKLVHFGRRWSSQR